MKINFNYLKFFILSFNVLLDFLYNWWLYWLDKYKAFIIFLNMFFYQDFK